MSKFQSRTLFDRTSQSTTRSHLTLRLRLKLIDNNRDRACSTRSFHGSIDDFKRHRWQPTQFGIARTRLSLLTRGGYGNRGRYRYLVCEDFIIAFVLWRGVIEERKQVRPHRELQWRNFRRISTCSSKPVDYVNNKVSQGHQNGIKDSNLVVIHSESLVRVWHTHKGK